MKMQPTVFAIAVATSISAGFTPVAAAIKTATYSGTLQSGTDLTGVFGAANTSLSGLNYIATFTYDRNLGGNQSAVPGANDVSSGGSFYGTASPIISASITINSITRIVTGGYDDIVLTSIAPQVIHTAQQRETAALLSTVNFITASFNPPTAAPSLDLDVAPIAATGSGSFQIFTRDDLSGATMTYAFGIFDNNAVYSVGSTSLAPVPEPGSWMLLVSGFGLMGISLRRRQKAFARS
jgi:hypothetical protein